MIEQLSAPGTASAALVALIAVLTVASTLAVTACCYTLPTNEHRPAARLTAGLVVNGLITLAAMALMVAIASA